jgi:Fe-S cluster assembly ATP-binding protein
LAFQHIPEVKGVKLFEFLKSIYDAKQQTKTSFLGFKKIIEPLLAELQIDKEFLWRDLNVGFSGGERRKTEILQIKLLEPTYIFLDEVDSGLDVDAFTTIAKHLREINHGHGPAKLGKNSFIIITHLFKIVDHLPIDIVYVMKDGEIIQEGDKKLIAQIAKT